jgi:hypothetical protein
MELTESEYSQLERLLSNANCIIKDGLEIYDSEYIVEERFELWEDEGEEWECIGLFPTQKDILNWLKEKNLH